MTHSPEYCLPDHFGWLVNYWAALPLLSLWVSLPILHQDPANETDLTFLNRLAGYYDAICKLVDNQLVFAKRGELKPISGKPIKPVTISSLQDNTPSNPAFVTATVSTSEKAKQKVYKAKWYNEKAAQEKVEQKGSSPYQLLDKHTNQKKQRWMLLMQGRWKQWGKEVRYQWNAQGILCYLLKGY